MDRRTFLVTLAGGLFAAPLAAEAQQPGNRPRIALVSANTPAAELAGSLPKSP